MKLYLSQLRLTKFFFWNINTLYAQKFNVALEKNTSRCVHQSVKLKSQCINS